MYKLVVLFAVLALSAAAPRPGLVALSAPVVSPAVTSYSAYSNSVVHGSPLVPVVPVVQQQLVHQPIVQQQLVQPVVHSVPVAYSAHVPTVFV